MSDFYKGMPKSVRIGCYDFIVEVGTRNEHENTFGWNDTFQQKISLAAGLRSQKLANTFIHEVIHGIHWFHGLLFRPEGVSPASEEEFTTLTANGLCAFWQDNPEAVKWWNKLVNIKE
jgi:hypothetical protein